MLTFVVDDLNSKFNNLVNPNFETEYWTIPAWLDYYKIDYNMVTAEHAISNSWYPIGINFWNFNQDYLQILPNGIREKLSSGEIRLLFSYREADDPSKIRDHIETMARQHACDPDQIWLLSGNSEADKIRCCRFFWWVDTNLYFQTKNSPVPKINESLRNHRVTCLSRVHKNWREYFVYNLYKTSDPEKNYISYGNVKNYDADSDFVLWKPLDLYIESRGFMDNFFQNPDEHWKNILPLRADDLDSNQHNTHNLIVKEHFQDSYWNIVLETLLSTENPDGISITEKTLKPLRNGQSFVILGCQHSLAFLRERGYLTFNNVIDESYDTVNDVRERWYRVLELSRYLSKMPEEQLHAMQQKSLPAICHNQQHFLRDRRQELLNLTTHLDAV